MCYFHALSETVIRCSAPSWCPTWRTCRAQSAWSCAASDGSCWNRLRRTPTRNAANWWGPNQQIHEWKTRKSNVALNDLLLFLFGFSEKEGVWNRNEQISQCKSCFFCYNFIYFFCHVGSFHVKADHFSSISVCRLCQRRSSSGSCLRRR